MADDLPEFEPLTLSNAGEGKLEKQFQEAVEQAYTIFAESHERGRYEFGVDASLKCTVGLEVALTLDLESRTLTVTSRVSKFTPLESTIRRRRRVFAPAGLLTASQSTSSFGVVVS